MKKKYFCLIILVIMFAILAPTFITAQTTWGPWIQTTWDQGGIYNSKCPYIDPTDPSRGRRWSGCVACSAAQILNYHQYPRSISFSSSDLYTSVSMTSGEKNPTVNIDADSGLFGFPSFAELNTALTNINYARDSEEIGNLGFAVGVKFQMQYGSGGSGAGIWPDPYLKGFGYGSAICSYDWSASRETVISNMMDALPVQIGIWNGGDERHSVIIDGFRSDDYFHLNYGWGSGDPRAIGDTWYDIPNMGAGYNSVIVILHDISVFQGWNQYSGDCENTFRTKYTFPKDAPQRKWAYTMADLGLDSSLNYFSDIVVGTAGRIYVAVNPKNVGYGYHPGILILNPQGYKEQFIQFQGTEQPILSLAQNSRGDIFFACPQTTVGGVTNATVVYRIPAVSANASIFYVHNSPDAGSWATDITIDHDDNLYFVVNPFLSSRASVLHCVAPDGTARWTYTLRSNWICDKPLAVGNGYVYAMCYNTSTRQCHLRNMQTSDGSENNIYSFPAGTDYIATQPMVGNDGNVYVGQYTTFYALNSDLSALRWSEDFNSIFVRHIAQGKDGTVYINNGETAGPSLHYTGRISARTSSGGHKWDLLSRALLDEDGDSVNNLYVDNNGHILMSYTWASPKEQCMVCVSDNGTSGGNIWDITAGDKLAFGSGNAIYAVPFGQRNSVYAFSTGSRGNPDELAMNYTNNHPPNVPDNPNPSVSATNQPTSVTLSWTCNDPDGQSPTYDVLVCRIIAGGEGCMLPVATGLVARSFVMSDLSGGACYLWKVIASDGQARTYGPTWCFSTTNSFPTISVTPSNRAFGSVTVGSTSDLTFTVQNTGGGTLSGSAGGVTPPFSIVSGGSYSLGAGASQTVTVRFSPVSVSNYNQNVNFTGGGGATQSVSGVGVVLLPFICTTNSDAITITGYTGTGGAVTIPATINGLPVTGIGSNAFYNCAILIRIDIGSNVTSIGQAAFASCVNLSQIYFGGNAPSVAADAFLNVTSATVYYLASATGFGSTFGGLPTAIYALEVLSVTPLSQDFGTNAVGASVTRNFTVQNTGGGTLSGIASVAAPFSITAGGAYSLASGQSQMVTVCYSPTSAGTNTANVSFTGGVGASRSVTGVAVSSLEIISVTPMSQSFGTIPLGHSVTKNFTVQNTGSGTLSGSASVAAPFLIVSGSPYSLTASQSQVLSVCYKPTAAGSAAQQITFTGGAGATVSVSGSASDYNHSIIQPWALGTFYGYVDGGGVATMTVTAKGTAAKATGRITTGGCNYTFIATSYGGDPVNGYTISTTAKSGRNAVPLTLLVQHQELLDNVAGSLGVVTGTLGSGKDIMMYRNVWKDTDMSGSPAGVAGYYTATMPNRDGSSGSGYIAFTIDAKGNVKTAGKLADGKAFSLAGPLLVAGAKSNLFIIVYAAPAAYKGGCLQGLVSLLAGTKVLGLQDDQPISWINSSLSGFDRTLDLVGGWYDKVGNLANYYSSGLSIGAGASTAPAVTVAGESYESVCWDPSGQALKLLTNPSSGMLTGISAANRGVAPKKVDGEWDYTSDNPICLTFSLTRATGLFRGSFSAWFDYGTTHTSKKISFEGMMTPVRAERTDGIEGRGFYLFGPAASQDSYDFLIQSGP